MKTLVNNKKILNKTGKIPLIDKINTIIIYQIDFNLCTCLISQYKLKRLYKKKLIHKFYETGEE
jgi:hypothetical protein